MSLHRRRGSAAGAALLAGALLLAGSWREGERAAPCREPSEWRAREGWTVEVACCGDGAPARALRGPARLLFGQTLDLNRADARALESLPGIGPSRAQAIERARRERPFATLEELERTPGIGPRTVLGLAGWAHVEPPVEGVGSGVGCPLGGP